MCRQAWLIGTLISALSLAAACTAADAPAPPGGGSSKWGHVTVLRDDYGVPHVYGSTLASLWYGVGYAQGQDRLWQAEMLRRTATGTAAELLGADAIEGDAAARSLLGPPARRAGLLDAARPETRVIFESFAEGMNAWIDEAALTGRLPVEYGALGSSPRPWTPDDSIAIFMLLVGNFGESGADELTNAADLEELTTRLGFTVAARVFADTHWLNDPAAPTSVPAVGVVTSAHGEADPKARRAPSAGRSLPRHQQTLQTAWERSLGRLGLRQAPASNAVVIAPRLSASGHAFLLAGPQMGYTAPQITHEMGIHGAGFDVTGMEIAGLPLISIGVAGAHAWTLTTGGSDNSDIYVESLDPDDPERYRFRGTWLDLTCRDELIPVRGAPDVTRRLCESVHGPVVARTPGAAFTRKTATRGLELQSYEAFLDLTRARSIEEFDLALQRLAYNFNVLYADTRGNIAYWHAGRIPLRAEDDDPWLPHDGTGPAEWKGVVPWAQMPRAINPDQGWLSSWNNKPSPTWDNSTRGFFDWGPVHRVTPLNRLLQRQGPGSVTMATLEEINRTAGQTADTPSGSAVTVFAPTLLGHMLEHTDASADARLPAIMLLLSSWDLLQVDADGDGRYDSPAVAVFNTWWQHLSDRVFADDLGNTLDANVVGNLLYRLLGGELALPLRHDYLGGESASQAFTRALIATLDTLEVQYDSTAPADWLQPAAVIGWMPLGAGRIPQTIWMNRGTYNQLVQLGGALRSGENVVSPGQSGDPSSPHFADQLTLYATWRYKPMRLDRRTLISHASSTLSLQWPPPERRR